MSGILHAMRRTIVPLVLASMCAACASDPARPPRHVVAQPAGAPRIEAPSAADPAALAARLAAADAKLAAVRAARSWPSVEDRERWERDIRVAESARARFEESRGTADESAALDAYEGCVAIAFASRRAAELGDLARQRP